ncbi:MAG: family 2 glycosyl transferase [Crocinitomicaceae bacterium]|nr:family 2 glycosyl transferase [Crocinitomicaceae bacterium]|tara:strand:- start:51 stop:857 length:807 start_codon:yes stop_codon:yes gene_type:complete
MLFSVVILSFNSQRTLDRCLDTLAATLKNYNEDSEIIVVENGSSDNSVGMLKAKVEQYPELIKPIYFEHNTGTTVSRNAALDVSQGRYVLVLDSDAYIEPDALNTLVDYLNNHPKVGMVAPKLFYDDGRFQKSVDVFPTLKRKVERFLSLNKMQASEDHESYSATDVDYAISACWLLKRDAVDSVGGFDENIFYSPEDVDYCMQVWQAGYQIHYVPEASVIHDAQELSRGFKLSKFHFSHLGGLFYLFKKYGYFFGLKGLYRRLGRFE